MEQENLNLILGALDSLGVALVDHDHHWTEGERAIYEKAVEIIQSPAHASVTTNTKAYEDGTITPAHAGEPRKASPRGEQGADTKRLDAVADNGWDIWPSLNHWNCGDMDCSENTGTGKTPREAIDAALSQHPE